MALSPRENDELALWAIVWAGATSLLLAFALYLLTALPQEIIGAAFFPAFLAIITGVVALALATVQTTA